MAELVVRLLGDSRSLERAFEKSSRSAKKFDSNISRTGSTARRGFSGLTKTLGLVTGGLGIYGVAGAAKAAFTEMADAQKVAAQTNAVLKSTGGAANVTAGHVDALANAMLKKTGIDDETIKSGENLLLTFTNIRNEAGKGNDVFDQATRTIADMSTALGQDTKSSAIQLGKALQDPIKGVTALRRVGVQFTKAQQDQIKALVKSGDTMGAQKVILAELNKEFGGSAEAAGKTLPGQLNILKQTMLNLGGSIAQTLVPAISKVVDKMVKWLSDSKNQKTVLDTVKSAVAVLTGALRVVKGAFDVLSKVVGGNKHAIELLVAAYATWKVASIAGSIVDLAKKFGGLTGKMGAAEGGAGTLGKSLGSKAGVAGMAVVAGYELSTLIRKIPGWDKAMKNFGGTVYGVASKIGLIHDPTAQFKGKTTPSQSAGTFIRRRAARLEQAGMTPAEAAARISATHPNLARRDVEVFAGVRGRAPAPIHINTVNIHGVKNIDEIEQQLQKRAGQRQQPRRGRR